MDVFRSSTRVIAFTTHVTMSVLFLAPFFRPDAFGGFLRRDAFAVMLFQFLGLHSGAILTQALKRTGIVHWLLGILIVGFYAAFSLPFAIAFGRPVLALYFGLSLIANLVPVKARGADAGVNQVEWGLSIATFILAAGLSLYLPLPHIDNAGVHAAQPNASGIWVDRPETLAAFGVLYFGVRAAFNLFEGRIARRMGDDPNTTPEAVALSRLLKEGFVGPADLARAETFLAGATIEAVDQAFTELRSLAADRAHGVLAPDEYNRRKWEIMARMGRPGAAADGP